MMTEQELIDEFHRLFYWKGHRTTQEQSSVPMEVHYCGYLVQKNPLDLWVYQEIIWNSKPDLIIEMGTASGGTALFMANILDLVGNEGQVITVDIVDRLSVMPAHPRITYVTGDARHMIVFDEMEKRVLDKKVMVVLDDNHSTEHVLFELELYGRLVTPGQYIIVEDTNTDDVLGFGSGPGRAVKEFLKTHSEFEVDRNREKFLMTWNPGGYLLRK